MRRLLWGQLMSLDRFRAGPGGELEWHVTDDDFARYVQELGKTIGAIVFGRKTYDMMAAYRPTSDQPEAPTMSDTPKLASSRTLHGVSWKNARLAKAGRTPVSQRGTSRTITFRLFPGP